MRRPAFIEIDGKAVPAWKTGRWHVEAPVRHGEHSE
jgi:hypothetical protein